MYDKRIILQADEALLNALREDLGNGDVTTLAVVPEKNMASAVVVAKEDVVISGLPFAERVFMLVDETVRFKARKREGSAAKKGDIIATVRGKTRSLLMAERTALNVLQRNCGIASLTRKYVRAVQGLNVKIVDTRKTAPGLRFLDKYAVKTGGGHNHRFGLYDGILIKDNHIAAAGGIGNAVRRVRKGAHHLFRVEIEASTLPEVREAARAGADIIMLDNMSLQDMRKSVDVIRSRHQHILIEASGNVTLETVRRVAETGVDIISVGALTHSAAAADLSMEIKPA
jgi:nicotinate-nucleotide pyrophosphorylase (carboxylating)